MLKFVISSVFLGSTLLGFSAGGSPFLDHIKTQDLSFIIQSLESHENLPVYGHIGMGQMNLYDEDYSSAIDNFIIAESFHKKSSLYQSELNYFICIGKAIAYDNLGMTKECNRTIGSLVLAEYGENGEFQELADHENPSLLIGKSITLSQSEECIQFLKELVSRAKSPNVRKYLTSFLAQLLNDD